VAAPIAGQTGMRLSRLPAYDLAGALFWAATLTLIGRFFGDVLRVHPGALSFMGHFAGAIFLLAICRAPGLPDLEAAVVFEAGSYFRA